MIQYEKNLVSYTKFLNRMNYITTADKKRSLACDTTEREKINFVDENGNVVEAGIIEKSDKDTTLYDYQFSKNSDGEITDCYVTKSHFKNDKSGCVYGILYIKTGNQTDTSVIQCHFFDHIP